ncbi:hypothetical protein ACFL27_24460 [candidate division CSSED10-310 bacterium]|uniref:Uncharacterized protein n=1 Tax=candidate division CSSED10-310 bacterium TaxID=2855610 RepID=A0ABV6Z4J3_UNCC1
MKVTGDEKGVRFLKKMYMDDQKDTMGYITHAKKKGLAYFRAQHGEAYILYEIRCTDGKTYNVSKFQEGSLRPEEVQAL